MLINDIPEEEEEIRTIDEEADDNIINNWAYDSVSRVPPASYSALGEAKSPV